MDEIVKLVSIALGNIPITECGAGDANGDSQITVDEILTAVNRALADAAADPTEVRCSEGRER